MCSCGDPRVSDFFVMLTIGRLFSSRPMEMEVGYSEAYLCADHMPEDANSLLSDEMLDAGWQVYASTVMSDVPSVLH